MEKPRKKLKKLLIITGTTGAVYAGFKYLLPLVAPFFAGYVIALLLRPSARFICYRLRFRAAGREWHLPVGVAGAAELVLLFSLVAFGLYQGFLRLCQEGEMLLARFPFWVHRFDIWLTDSCCELEQVLGLKPGFVGDNVGQMLLELARRARAAAMPALVSNSVAAASFLGRTGLWLLVTFLAAVLSLQEMEDIRDRRDKSLFRQEFRLIGDRLVKTGKAWFKSQGIILFITCGLCTLGMILMENPYYISLGVGIGVLDALPLFGTGTVLIPWALAEAFGGNWTTALFLLGLYLACYLVRQLLEARLMGGQVGLSPLETLAAVYVGLLLFGFFGFILGPFGLLLISDLTENIGEAD